MTTITAIIIGIFGAAIGSFLSVLLYRVENNRSKKKKMGIIFSRSVCPHCKKKLKWRHLVPVLSWVFLRGKCGYCGKKVSIHYLALEILTATLFVITFFNFNFLQIIPSTVDPEFLNYAIDWKIFEIFIFYIIEFSFLITIFFYDLMHKEIPDRFSLPAIAIAIAGGLTLGFPIWTSMLLGGVGLSAFFALQFILSKGTWIGGGDIRLGALMGILVGWEKGLLALVIAYIIGALISIILLLTNKVTRKSTIPFGPFLVGSTILTIFFGDFLLNWYLNFTIF